MRKIFPRLDFLVKEFNLRAEIFFFVAFFNHVTRRREVQKKERESRSREIGQTSLPDLSLPDSDGVDT